jgi:hypothetical protein
MTLVRAPIGSLLKSVDKARKPVKARAKDDDHLAFLRTLPCVVTGSSPVEAAHIRYGSKIWGKPISGIGTKPDDRWCLPLSPDKHREQHSGSEAAFWKAHGIEPLVTAARLYEASGDHATALKIIRDAQAARTK